MPQDSEGSSKESRPPLLKRGKRWIVRRVAHWFFEFDVMAHPRRLRERWRRFDTLQEEFAEIKETFQANRHATERLSTDFVGLKETFQTFRREQVEANKAFREHAHTTGRLETEYTNFKEAFQAFRKKQADKNRELSEGLDGFRAHLANLRKRDDALEGQLELLKAVLESAAANPQVFWLFADRVERMDANLPIYDEARRRFHRARYEFAAAYVAGTHVAGTHVADIACGTGYGTAVLKHDGGACTVSGIDIDADAVAYAQAVYGGEGIRFIVADGAQTGLESGTFDTIVSFETIEHVPDDQALVAEFARLLKPGGRLVVSTPNQWPLAIAPYHVREYDRSAFEAVLSPHFEIDALYNQNSGTTSQFNRGQPEGIVETTPENEELAECYIAVCTRR